MSLYDQLISVLKVSPTRKRNSGDRASRSPPKKPPKTTRVSKPTGAPRLVKKTIWPSLWS